MTYYPEPDRHIRNESGSSIRLGKYSTIFRIQDNESIMCGFYCVPFIEYMFAEKILPDYTNLFSPNNYEKNDKIIYNCFKYKYVKSRI